MTSDDNPGAGTERSATASHRVGLYSAVLTVVIAVCTFGLAITAIPNSGAGCTENCFEYPYVNSLSQFPQDYLWMPPAMLLTVVYVILMVSIHTYSAQHKKIYSQVALSFALIAAGILLSIYYIQFFVVPVSLMNEETEGIALLTQYNPHGVFIVLEELGYLIMALSFLFVAPVFADKGRLESAVRWVFVAGFVLIIVALTAILIRYGLDREDRFEIAAISVDWLVLIINGVLLSIVFRRQLQKSEPYGQLRS
ncbi:MAG TPA: hypothetical protein VK869_14415 [Rubrobacteraceae bacterium]|nr:hypothetical protein [Rubrobacteraceae bacterium]